MNLNKHSIIALLLSVGISGSAFAFPTQDGFLDIDPPNPTVYQQGTRGQQSTSGLALVQGNFTFEIDSNPNQGQLINATIRMANASEDGPPAIQQTNAEQQMTIQVTNGTAAFTLPANNLFSGAYCCQTQTKVGDQAFSYLRVTNLEVIANVQGAPQPLTLINQNYNGISANEAIVGTNANNGAVDLEVNEVPSTIRVRLHVPFFVFFQRLTNVWSIRFLGLDGPEAVTLEHAERTQAGQITQLQNAAIPIARRDLLNNNLVKLFNWQGANTPYRIVSATRPNRDVGFRLRYQFNDGSTKCSTWTWVTANDSAPVREQTNIRIWFSKNQSGMESCQ